MFSNILSSLLQYVKNCYNNNVTEIPAATLLMGINMPDHSAQFSALSDVIKREITPHVATLHAQDCPNVKHLVENMVSQFVNEIPEDVSTYVYMYKFIYYQFFFLFRMMKKNIK